MLDLLVWFLKQKDKMIQQIQIEFMQLKLKKIIIKIQIKKL
jgi:hypothetical protein